MNINSNHLQQSVTETTLLSQSPRNNTTSFTKTLPRFNYQQSKIKCQQNESQNIGDDSTYQIYFGDQSLEKKKSNFDFYLTKLNTTKETIIEDQLENCQSKKQSSESKRFILNNDEKPNLSNTQVNQQRIRFQNKSFEKVNLFEGLPYIQYEYFVRHDRRMQSVIIHDGLKITVDKTHLLKNILLDKLKLNKIMNKLNLKNQIKLNQLIETSLTLSQSIINLIKSSLAHTNLQTYLYKKQINSFTMLLKLSPLEQVIQSNIFNQNQSQFLTESVFFDQNCEIFCKQSDFLKHWVDLLFLQYRQYPSHCLDDINCQNMLKFVTQLRYNISEICEQLRIFEATDIQKHYMIQQVNHHSNSPSQVLNNDSSFLDFQEELKRKRILEQKQKLKKVQQLIHQKMSTAKHQGITRESKVILSSDNSEEYYQLEGHKKNRKYQILPDQLTPTSSPEVRRALCIANKLFSIKYKQKDE